MATCVANMATCIAQVLLKLVDDALLINQLWFGLAFLGILANPTDKDGLDCGLELET